MVLIIFLNGWGYSCFMEVAKKLINALYVLCWRTRYHIFAISGYLGIMCTGYGGFVHGT